MSRIPRCGDCIHRCATWACTCLSSTHCTKERSADAPACPWWRDLDDPKPLPAVHQERQTADRNHPRGMAIRATWG
jgi:hypothetical protein